MAGISNELTNVVTVEGDAFQFKVNYNKIKREGDYVCSPTFSAGGHEWSIHCGIKKENNTEYAIFDLELSESENVVVSYTSFLLNSDGTPAQITAMVIESYTFVPKVLVFCHSCITSLVEKLLSNGCFVVVCTIKVISGSRKKGPKGLGSFDIPRYLGLQYHLLSLMMKGEITDVTFQVEGECLSAHRVILAARSPVFRAEFFGSMTESGSGTKHVIIKDVCPDVFKSLLHFIYMDSIPDLDYNMASHLLVAVDRYGVERLKLICEIVLCKEISLGTIVSILALAEHYSCTRLKNACIKFVALPNNRADLILNEEYLKLILSSPSLMTEIRKEVKKK